MACGKKQCLTKSFFRSLVGQSFAKSSNNISGEEQLRLRFMAGLILDFARRRRGSTGGLWQEFDDFPVFPDNHRNAHETVFLGGFLHGPLHDFGNFLNALVCGFHGGSR